jgi:hypothetical protein
VSRVLPRCPCGSQSGQATWTIGRQGPAEAIDPGRVVLEPCGHAFEWPSPEYAALRQALHDTLVAEQPEDGAR